MIVDQKDTTNGHGYDLNCSMKFKTEAENNYKDELRIYKRKKRRKMSNCDSDEMKKIEFDDKVLNWIYIYNLVCLLV